MSIPGKSGLSKACRICLVPTPADISEPEVSLMQTGCKCRGTLEYIHTECFSKWLKHHNSNVCEICRGEYGVPLRLVRRGTYLQYIRSNRVAAVELVLFAIASIYVLAAIFCSNFDWETMFLKLAHFGETLDITLVTAQAIVIAFLASICAFASILSVAYHMTHFYSWRGRNMVYELAQ